jgi:branched-chain amino acid transport system ATP-binding protein
MAQVILSLSNVSKVFGGLRAVDQVSLQVTIGERRVLIGPNGAGKTSLFHCISGTHHASAGKILYLGRDITHLHEFDRTILGIGRTFQISSVLVDLTVLENIVLAILGIQKNKWQIWRHYLKIKGVESKALAQLGQVGLQGQADVFVKNLSYGERRQLELALALVNNPLLLLLDEPCAGLSPSERQKLFNLIKSLPRSITMLMIEHDMDVALGLADRVTVLHQGRVILEGDSDEVRQNPQVREIYFGQA